MCVVKQNNFFGQWRLITDVFVQQLQQKLMFNTFSLVSAAVFFKSHYGALFTLLLLSFQSQPFVKAEVGMAWTADFVFFCILIPNFIQLIVNF